ncbi:hypothetical protein HYX11_00170 [Candidatus Woesearchaeota archaeon]|nr:hypothetical protein [Candidatus Woesearchaeota archaeon]
MKRLLLDTNIYGLLTVDSDLHLLHSLIEQKRGEFRIYGFSVVRKELKKVPKKVVGGVNVQASLLRAYSYFIVKEYDIEGMFERIAEEYYKNYVFFGGNLLKEEIYNDLLIVACASVKNVDIVVSEDNGTMWNEVFRKAYENVNLKFNVGNPSFIRYKQFKELLRGTTFTDPFINSANKFGIFLSLFYICKIIFGFSFHIFIKERLIYKSFVINYDV